MQQINKKENTNAKRKLSGVVFDMDGLMFDTERIVQHSWNIVGEEMGYGQLGELIYHTLGMTYKRREQFFHEQLGQDFPYEEFAKRYRKVWYGIKETKGIPVKPGLLELLKFLKEQNCLMAVATSSSAEHCAKNLEEAGIADYFTACIDGSMVQHSKPDPEIYLKACEKMGIHPSEAVGLEDSVNGLRSVQAGGLMAIMIPDLIQDAPAEVEEKLEAKLESLEDCIPYFAEQFQMNESKSDI